MTVAIDLPARLDLSNAAHLLDTLRQHEGPMHLNAADVTHMGALCLQILVSASRHAHAQGTEFDLTNLSDTVAEQMMLMGCPADRLAKGDI